MHRTRAAVLLLLMAPLWTGPAAASSWAGRPLREMIEDIRAGGLAVLYSSDLVRNDMRVTAEPRGGDPLTRLREVLAPFGLTGRAMPNSGYAIVNDPALAHRIPRERPDSIEREVDEVLVQGHSSQIVHAAAEPRTDIPAMESPGSISVISMDSMSGRNPQTLTEMLAYTAGVTGEEGAANLSDDILVIRGFPVERVFVDGMVRQMSSLDFTTEPYGLARLEVLKGPASALFGQMAPGGVVNAVTKRPSETPVHEVQAQTGLFNRTQFAIDSSGSVDNVGRWLYRVTALGRNSNTSVDFARNNRRYLAPAVTWKPSERSSFTLLTSYQADQTSYHIGLPSTGTVSFNPNGIIPANRSPGEPSDYLRSTGKAATAIFEYHIDETWSARQSLRYARFDADSRTTWNDGFKPDLRTLDRTVEAGRSRDDALTLDSRLQGRFVRRGLEHRFLVGFDYQHLLHGERFSDGKASPLDIFAPVYGRPADPLSPSYGEDNHSMQLGLYVSDQLKLHGKWVWLFSGRYDAVTHETQDWLPGTQIRQKDRAGTRRAGWVYLASNGLAPYVSFSDSFEPTVGLNTSRIPYRPTNGRQYEAGIKYLPDNGRFLVTAAVYDLRQRNVPTPDPQNHDSDLQRGAIRSRGIEVETRMDVSPRFDLAATYTHTDATVTGSEIADEVGMRRGGVPRETATLWMNYLFRSVHVGLGARYIGRNLSTFDAPLQTSPFTVGDVLVGYTTGRWNLALFGSNFFDERYVEACSYGCFYGRRREVVASVAYRWE